MLDMHIAANMYGTFKLSAHQVLLYSVQPQSTGPDSRFSAYAKVSLHFDWW